MDDTLLGWSRELGLERRLHSFHDALDRRVLVRYHHHCVLYLKRAAQRLVRQKDDLPV